ncbi:RNA 2',3'-cyclic phosphodiesterase [Ornithinibacillus halotolerans]|uniref:RNA 2',3'-cyclic phosphodiesterase n=1 Tax=Ornithinibacillus halotolerans TaxID=1274357 RepID=A0A916S5Z0_9BACI|nr:RNA 2',3'-cyclic phosphodiesterase [Ornithinibacillus halotolerans]GGA82616.1 RNA 2',3'-cyclic phosphodiesterase [Ornithinibacillus halotolerans]
MAHYFIAIPITKELAEEISIWQIDLKEKLAYKNWPYQDDLHITLKFLGEVEDKKLERLRNELKSVQYHDFSITIGSIGTFGKDDRPRVLWAGVENTDEVNGLHNKIEEVSASVGFPKENRPYRPHITLAKKWNGTTVHTMHLDEIKELYKDKTYTLHVDEFVLYQIFPSQIPKYKRIDTFQLIH